jgi:hypothetical protein
LKVKAAASTILECVEQLAVTPVPLDLYPGKKATVVPIVHGKTFQGFTRVEGQISEGLGIQRGGEKRTIIGASQKRDKAASR